MRALAVALALLATPAEALTLQQAVDWAHCRLYPSHERCRPPAQTPSPPAPLPPPPAPAATPAPAIAPPLMPAKAAKPVKPVKRAAPAKPKRVKSTFKPGLPSWCAEVPKGTTMGQVEFYATLKGKKLTASNRRQAQACINSK